MKERVARKKLKEAISRESNESDLLFTQAQDFILNCKDEAKVRQLLELMDEEKRSSLMDSIKT